MLLGLLTSLHSLDNLVNLTELRISSTVDLDEDLSRPQDSLDRIVILTFGGVEAMLVSTFFKEGNVYHRECDTINSNKQSLSFATRMEVL